MLTMREAGRRLRRWRNLRRSAHSGWPWGLAGLFLAFAGGGAWAICAHALALGDAVRSIEADQPALRQLAQRVPDADVHIPTSAGVKVQRLGGGTLISMRGMSGGPVVDLDLCGVARVEREAGAVLAKAADARHVALAGVAGLPAFSVQSADGRLRLHWQDASLPAIDEDGQQQSADASFAREAWLLLPEGGAVHLLRTPAARCGQLQLRAYVSAQARGQADVVLLQPGQDSLRLRMAPGDYHLPARVAAGEDAQLFAALRERGLLRLSSSGEVELAPRDLAAWRALPAWEQAASPSEWQDARLDDTGRRLLRRLYTQADGAFVRTQTALFNREREWAGVRIAQSDAAKFAASAPGAAPEALARLLHTPPEGWGAWHAAEAGQVRLVLRQAARGGERFSLLVAGHVRGLEGARSVRTHALSDASAGPGTDQINVLEVEAEAGVRQLHLAFDGMALDRVSEPGDAAYRFIRIVDGQPQWQQALTPMAGGQMAPWTGRIVDRGGRLLWQGGAPEAAARSAGLASLLGVDARHANSLAGMFGRLPATPQQAMLTIDLPLQQAAQQALDCIGMREGRPDADGCKAGHAAPAGRQAGAILIDTETGAILATAGAGMGSLDHDWPELRAFDRAWPDASPLRLPAWQHDGGAERSPGSTFKMISALGLELAAQHQPRLDRLLAGASLDTINSEARAAGFAFDTRSSTYPVAAASLHITNFRDQQLDRKAVDGHFGLGQALTYSLNTWFAWTAELADASLVGKPEGGLPGLQSLAATGLDGLRPVLAMAHRLGFGQALRLDGGLLPPEFGWQSRDALQSSPAGIDPVADRHQLRQLAIGLRMQATPLHMALAAGAVGQGGVITPHLLADLDGHAAQVVSRPALGVRLDRIRAGLHGVIERGTGASAFAGPSFAALRPGLFGKTGTAPVPFRSADGRELSTVWFAGWLEPDAGAGRPHRVAVAVFISRSGKTGGEHAAPVAAAILAAYARQSAEQKGNPPSAKGLAAGSDRG